MSHFFVWAAENLRPETIQSFTSNSLSNAVPRVSREELAANLTDIVQRSCAIDAEVLLVSPTVNLLWPPLQIDDSPESVRLHREYKHIQEALVRKEEKAALASADRVLADSSKDFCGLWLKGYVLSAMGKTSEGSALLEEAFERAPFPDRSKLSYRQTVAQVAAKQTTRFLDANALFATQAQPSTMYFGWCHPSVEGHRVLAEALVAEVHLRDKH